MVIFHSYVKLPEGTLRRLNRFDIWQCQQKHLWHVLVGGFNPSEKMKVSWDYIPDNIIPNILLFPPISVLQPKTTNQQESEWLFMEWAMTMGTWMLHVNGFLVVSLQETPKRTRISNRVCSWGEETLRVTSTGHFAYPTCCSKTARGCLIINWP